MPPPDAEQLQLDLEDANKRLDQLREAMCRKEEAESLVRDLIRKLAQARRQVREAGWKLSLLLAREKR